MRRTHNGAVNGNQGAAVCPQCGSAAGVHSIQELAALARAHLGELQQGYPGASQPGWAAEPQPGWAAEPQPWPPPGSGAAPGYRQEPRPGPLPGRGRRGYSRTTSSGSDYTSPEDDLASLALTEAARFIGRAIGKRVQRTYEQVQPALAARGEAMLRTQIAIAERHPDVCACLNDGVIFLAGGRRVLPMPNLSTLTVEQADALVATLQSG